MTYGIGSEALHIMTGGKDQRNPVYALLDEDGDFIIMCNDLDIVTATARDLQKDAPRHNFTVVRMIGIALPKTVADAKAKTAEMLLELILKRLAKTKGDFSDLTPAKLNAVLDELMADFDFKNAPDAVLREAGERLEAALQRDRDARAKAKTTGSKS